MLELSILGFLFEEPLHGYGVKARIQGLSSHIRPVSDGALYPAISRLVKAGLVDQRTEPGTGAAPRRILSSPRRAVLNCKPGCDTPRRPKSPMGSAPSLCLRSCTTSPTVPSRLRCCVVGRPSSTSRRASSTATANRCGPRRHPACSGRACCASLAPPARRRRSGWPKQSAAWRNERAPMAASSPPHGRSIALDMP